MQKWKPKPPLLLWLVYVNVFFLWKFKNFSIVAHSVRARLAYPSILAVLSSFTLRVMKNRCRWQNSSKPIPTRSGTAVWSPAIFTTHAHSPFTSAWAALITLLISNEGLMGYMVGKDETCLRSYGQAAVDKVICTNWEEINFLINNVKL